MGMKLRIELARGVVAKRSRAKIAGRATVLYYALPGLNGRKLLELRKRLASKSRRSPSVTAIMDTDF
jgi:hypothetical protein